MNTMLPFSPGTCIKVQELEQNVYFLGAGITVDNLQEILALSGAVEFHGTARESIESCIKFTKPGLSMGPASIQTTSTKIVQQLLSIFNKRNLNYSGCLILSQIYFSCALLIRGCFIHWSISVAKLRPPHTPPQFCKLHIYNIFLNMSTDVNTSHHKRLSSK